jgi:hypothetical protein
MSAHPVSNLPGSVRAHASLVAACRTLLLMRGIPCFRVNPRSVRKANGSWSSPGADVGAPDLIGCLSGGRILYVECKTGTSRLRPEQRASMDRWVAAGALCLVVRDVSELDAVVQTAPSVHRATCPSAPVA